MLEWVSLVLLISAIMGFVIIVKRQNGQANIIDAAGGIIVIFSVVALVFVGICCLDGVDVKVGLSEGSTYLVKSATYSGDKVTLDLQKIDVATNVTIGPEFLHKRNAELIDLEAGDIVIYQDEDIRHWVSPF